MTSVDRPVVPIFVDVDGVLNNNWHGNASPQALDPNRQAPVDPILAANLAQLVSRIEKENLTPRIVLSTTWRLDKHLLDRLIECFISVSVAGKSCTNLSHYFYGSQLGTGDAATPDLKDGSSPEGRAAEIRAWLAAHEHPNYLVFDDLNLLFCSDGKFNSMIPESNFIHTHDEGGTLATGLTDERVEAALKRIAKLQAKPEEGRVGKWSAAEWEVLKRSNMPLAILAKDTVPFWIESNARAYIKQQLEPPPQRKGFCLCS